MLRTTKCDKWSDLGYTISNQTVGNSLTRHGIAPAPERKTEVCQKPQCASTDGQIQTGFAKRTVL